MCTIFAAYDVVPGELEPEISSEAVESTIIHIMGKYCCGFGTQVVAIEETVVEDKEGDTEASKVKPEVQRYVPAVLSAIEQVLQLTSSQVVKTHERAVEGYHSRTRFVSCV